MRKKCYWLFTIHTDNMLSDVLDPTRVLYVKTEINRKV